MKNRLNRIRRGRGIVLLNVAPLVVYTINNFRKLSRCTILYGGSHRLMLDGVRKVCKEHCILLGYL